MFNNLTFEYPYFLLTILIFIFCSYFCKERSPSFLFIHLDIFKNSTSKTNLLMPILKYLSILFAIIALASPIKILDSKVLKKDGIDMILSLDTSGSMKERGFNENNIQENRWQVVRSIVNDFIDKRENDNIGLVVFGTSVLTASPLSFDKNAQKEILRYLDIGIVGERTSMYDSIATSINILKESKAKSKIVILLSDGEDTASKIPIQVINQLAKKYNIKIYAIGIGNSNQYILKTIADETNGKSFLANSKNDLVNIYEEINKLEKSKIDDNKIVLKDYLFFYPLFLSILFLIIFIYIKNKD